MALIESPVGEIEPRYEPVLSHTVISVPSGLTTASDRRAVVGLRTLANSASTPRRLISPLNPPIRVTRAGAPPLAETFHTSAPPCASLVDRNQTLEPSPLQTGLKPPGPPVVSRRSARV